MTTPLKLGIVTPVLSRRPGGHAEWERDAGIDEVRRVAEAAERLGYHYMTCSEHVAVPADTAPLSGYSYWDPLATFGYLAAHTSRIRFATIVLVLAYSHPLEVCKRYGTLDRICDGRLILGVGVGYSEKEFALLDVPFENRGERGDDALRAIRAGFGQLEPEYDGAHYRFGGMVVHPHGVQAPAPIWVGGQSRRSLRRAVELGDGWAPFAVTPEQVRAWLAAASETESWGRRDKPLDVTLVTEPPLDPLGAPEETATVARTLRDAGATMLQLRFEHRSLDHYLEQLEAMVALVARL